MSSEQPSEKAFSEAVEQMKLGTRRYAKRQVAWIRNKLLPVVQAANAASQSECGRPSCPTYLLDATGKHATRYCATSIVDLPTSFATELGDAWKENVHDTADRLTTGQPMKVSAEYSADCRLQLSWKKWSFRIR